MVSIPIQQADERDVEDHQKYVPDPEAHDQAPEHVGMIDHQPRPRRDAVDHQHAHDQRHGRAARNAEREGRDEGGLVGGVVGRFRRDDALDRPLAEA